jgi:AhpD family alkylhydroperoxidase
MTPRGDMTKYLGTPAGRAMLALSQASETSGLEPGLLELVKIRSSQLNGCAYCIDMHTKDARARGESEGRIYALSAWRDTPFFSDRERAALEWAEAVTLVGENHLPDELYDRTRQHFDEGELVKLTFAAVVINSWNRLVIAFRPVVGSYQPAAAAATRA